MAVFEGLFPDQHHGLLIWACNMAWFCKISSPHWVHSTGSWYLNNLSWLQPLALSNSDLWSICNTRNSLPGGSSWMSESCCCCKTKYCSRGWNGRTHGYYNIMQGKSSKVQPCNIQGTCTWRLHHIHLHVWYNRQLFNSIGKKYVHLKHAN